MDLYHRIWDVVVTDCGAQSACQQDEQEAELLWENLARLDRQMEHIFCHAARLGPRQLDQVIEIASDLAEIRARNAESFLNAPNWPARA
jgi:hypothetical protein